jgi:hypothetical protein
VKALLDRFRSRAPEEVRALARETGEAVSNVWHSYWRPADGLASPAGKLVLAGGVLLFGAGWLIGRKVRFSPESVALTTAAVVGGVVAGVLIGARLRTESSAPPDAEAEGREAQPE